MDSTMQDQRTHRNFFPWWKLAPELRNRIYALVLTTNDGKFLRIESLNNITIHRVHIRKKFTPNLLRINKQTHREGLGILYGDNHFHFIDARCLELFVTKVGARGIRYVKKVTVELTPNDHSPVQGDRPLPTRLTLFRDAPKLQRLTILTDQVDLLHPDWLATWLHRDFDVRVWLVKITDEELDAALNRMIRILRRPSDGGSGYRLSLNEMHRAEFNDKLRELVTGHVPNRGPLHDAPTP